MPSSNLTLSVSGWFKWVAQPSRAVWVLPSIVVVAVLVLTGLGISGTSTPALTPDKTNDSSVIFGTPRAIRSDEWMTRTPLVVSQSERGFPRFAGVGIGEHDMSVLSDLPTATWPEVFRPHQLGYFLLPVAHGFAFEWWASAAILILGVYALVLVLFGDWRWATAAALVMYASPFFHWWYQPTLFGLVGWSAAAVAALLWSFQSGVVGWRRWLRVALATYAGCCFTIFLYPPAQIPILFVLIAVIVGAVWPRLADRSWEWRRLLVNSLVALGGMVVVLGLFIVTHRSTLSAIANTVYPGARRETGGGGLMGHLFTGWFGLHYVSNDAGMRGVIFSNESEASSFLYLGLLVIPALPFVWQFLFGVGRRLRIFAISLLSVIAILFIHFAVGLPRIIARLSLLDRVQFSRVLPALGLASILLLIVIAKSMEGRWIPKGRMFLAQSTMAVLGVAFVGSLGLDFRNAGAPIDRIAILTSIIFILVPGLLWFWRPMVSMSVLIAVGFVVCIGINPLVRGLDHMTSTPFATEVRQLDADSGAVNSVWMTDNWATSSVITAAGVDNLSGVNLYPNADAWRLLDPSGRYENIWNRYSITSWRFVSGLLQPEFFLLQPDVIEIQIDPCAPQLTDLGIRWIVSANALRSSCLQIETVVAAPSGGQTAILKRTP